MNDEHPTFMCPVPIVSPFGQVVKSAAVQDVWDTFIKPGQDQDREQSVEERVLMAVLRAVHKGLTEAGL